VKSMADISMCSKSDCPSFENCYRAQAAPNQYRQSYMAFDNNGAEKCDDFIAVKNYSNDIATPE